MALDAAVGPWATPQQTLRATLADCTYFRTWAGAANQAAALAKIHNFDTPEPADDADAHALSYLQTLRPIAVVFTEPQQGLVLTNDSGGASFGYHARGNLVLCFENDITSDQAANLPELDRTIQNAIGRIVQSGDTDNPGLLELAGQAGYLATREVAFYGWFRNDVTEASAAGDYYRVYLDIAWGR